MKLLFVFSLFLFTFLVSNYPVIYYRDLYLSVPNTLDASTLILTIDFGQDIYLMDNSKNTSQLISSLNFTYPQRINTPSYLQPSLSAGSASLLDTFSLSCDGFSNLDVNPNNFMFPLLPTSEDAAISLYESFTSGSTDYVFDLSSQVLSFAIIGRVSDYINREDLDGVFTDFYQENLDSCTISFKSSNFSVTYLNGSMPTDINTFQPFDSTCNSTKLESIKEKFDNISTTFSASGKSNLNSKLGDIGKLFLAKSWYDCESAIYNYLMEGTVEYSFESYGYCSFEESDPNFATDACCNETLSLTECCISTTYNYNSTGLVEDTSVTSIKCQNPDIISVYLEQFLDFESTNKICKTNFDASIGNRDIWNYYTNFISVCYEKIYNIDDQDCQYDSECETFCLTSTGKCFIPYDDAFEFLLPCFFKYMDAELLAYLKIDLETYDNDTLLLERFSETFSANSCTGPTSNLYQDKYEYFYYDSCDPSIDYTCEEYVVYTPGNVNECLLELGYNYVFCSSPEIDGNLTLCQEYSDYYYGSGSCKGCIGSNCLDVSVTAQCFVEIYDTQYCEYFGGSSEYGYCHIFGSGCTWCNSTDDCNNLCIYSMDEDQNLCNYEYDVNTSICYSRQDLESCTGSYIHSYYNIESFLTEEQSCTGSLCVSDLSIGSTCNDSTFCTGRTPKCSTNDPSDGVCIGSVVNSSCHQNFEGKCIYDYNQTDCIASGHMFHTCSLLSISECFDCVEGANCSIPQSYYTCFIDFEASTPVNQCATSGYCTDEVFVSSSTSSGYCIYNNTNTFLSVEDIEVTDLGFLNRKTSNKTECMTNGGNWFRRSHDEESCLNNKLCYNNFGMIVDKNETSCTECQYGYDSLFYWQSGEVKTNNFKLNLGWENTTIKQLNRLVKSFDDTKFHSYLEGLISDIYSNAYLTRSLCENSALLTMVSVISCDCNNGTDCFDYEPSLVATANIIDGFPQVVRTKNFEITFNATNSTKRATAAQTTRAQISLIDPASLYDQNITSCKRAEVCKPYYIVRSTTNQIIGQIAGPAVKLSLSNNRATTICFTTTLEKDPRFPVDGIARRGLDFKFRPISSAIQVINGKICATVGEPGDYIPIYKGQPVTCISTRDIEGESVCSPVGTPNNTPTTPNNTPKAAPNNTPTTPNNTPKAAPNNTPTTPNNTPNGTPSNNNVPSSAFTLQINLMIISFLSLVISLLF